MPLHVLLSITGTSQKHHYSPDVKLWPNCASLGEQVILVSIWPTAKYMTMPWLLLVNPHFVIKITSHPLVQTSGLRLISGSQSYYSATDKEKLTFEVENHTGLHINHASFVENRNHIMKPFNHPSLLKLPKITFSSDLLFTSLQLISAALQKDTHRQWEQNC